MFVKKLTVDEAFTALGKHDYDTARLRDRAKKHLRGHIENLEARLKLIAEIIEAVDDRALAVDGPVTPTKDEITADELKAIYRAAKGVKS